MGLATLFGMILVGMALVMVAAWATQRARGDSGWIDVFWTFGTGAAGVLAALWPTAGADPARKALAAVLLAAWALRLGFYIFRRVARGTQEDARYAAFRRDWGERYQTKLFWLTLPQAGVTTLMMVSVAIAANRQAPGLDARDLAAALTLLIAILGEGLADAQLARFKRSGPPKGSINDRGLWAWSRHPNYFFEWLGWLAWPVMALDPGRPVTWLTLLAPAAIYVVLRFVTGVPPLEATMLASRGEAFRAYKRRTAAFFPFPPRDVRP
jgi:steroid 5-alpha reductase family enzyme